MEKKTVPLQDSSAQQAVETLFQLEKEVSAKREAFDAAYTRDSKWVGRVGFGSVGMIALSMASLWVLPFVAPTADVQQIYKEVTACCAVGFIGVAGFIASHARGQTPKQKEMFMEKLEFDKAIGKQVEGIFEQLSDLAKDGRVEVTERYVRPMFNNGESIHKRAGSDHVFVADGLAYPATGRKAEHMLPNTVVNQLFSSRWKVNNALRQTYDYVNYPQFRLPA